MVLGKILIDVGKIAIRNIRRYYKYENKLFDLSYKGYSSQVRRGVKHGYIVGGITGSLIAPDTPGNDNGIPAYQQKPKQSTTRQSYQTRYRRTRRDSCGYPGQQPDFSRRR